MLRTTPRTFVDVVPGNQTREQSGSSPDRTAAADDSHRVALEDRQLPRDGRRAVRLVLRTRVDMYLRSLPGPRGSLSREHRAHLSETYCRCHKQCRIDDTARVRGDRRIEAG
jgi:hypothetical protein